MIVDRCDWLIGVVEGPIDSLFIPNSIAMVGSGAIDNIHDRFRDSDVVYVLDNEPRNTQIAKYNEKLIKMGKQVCIWPSEMLDKDMQMLVGKTGLTDEAGETLSSVVSIKRRIVGIVI